MNIIAGVTGNIYSMHILTIKARTFKGDFIIMSIQQGFISKARLFSSLNIYAG